MVKLRRIARSRFGIACALSLLAQSPLLASSSEEVQDPDCQVKMEALYSGRENDFFVKISPSAYNDRKLGAIVSGAQKTMEGQTYGQGCEDKDLQEFARFAYMLAHPETEWNYDFAVLANRRPEPLHLAEDEVAYFLVEASRQGLLCPNAGDDHVFLKSSKVRKMLRSGAIQEAINGPMPAPALFADGDLPPADPNKVGEGQLIEKDALASGEGSVQGDGFLLPRPEAVEVVEHNVDDPYGVQGFFGAGAK